MLVNLAVSKKCEYSGMSTRKAMSLVMCKTRKNWPNISAARASRQVFHARNRIGCAPLSCFAFFWKGRACRWKEM